MFLRKLIYLLRLLADSLFTITLSRKNYFYVFFKQIVIVLCLFLEWKKQ